MRFKIVWHDGGMRIRRYRWWQRLRDWFVDWLGQ